MLQNMVRRFFCSANYNYDSRQSLSTYTAKPTSPTALTSAAGRHQDRQHNDSRRELHADTRRDDDAGYAARHTGQLYVLRLCIESGSVENTFGTVGGREANAVGVRAVVANRSWRIRI